MTREYCHDCLIQFNTQAYLSHNEEYDKSNIKHIAVILFHTKVFVLYGLDCLIECLSHSADSMNTVPGNITVYGFTQFDSLLINLEIFQVGLQLQMQSSHRG